MAKIFKYNHPFTLESGIVLPGFHLAYTTHGELAADKSNVAWIFHALTANSDPAEWWPGLVGSETVLDPAKYFIICVNMPGSCYGSLGPLDADPGTGKTYYHDFPFFTTRDMVRAYRHLKAALGIVKIKIGIGGSMGGQQLLEWAIEEPAAFEYIVPLATNAFHSPWGIAFNATQRHCIEADPSWQKKDPAAGLRGMSIARGIALLSYRNYDTYLLNQAEEDTEKTDGFKAASYQQYQGQKLVARFNAFSYFFLGKGMDAHNVGRGRGSVAEALKKITAKTLVLSISSDLLFPVQEQQLLATHINGAAYTIIDSDYAHDGFLLEAVQIGQAIQQLIL